MVLQNYQNLIEITSNIFHNIAFGVGFKGPRKIHLNTQWGGGDNPLAPPVPTALDRSTTQLAIGSWTTELTS